MSSDTGSMLPEHLHVEARKSILVLCLPGTWQAETEIMYGCDKKEVAQEMHHMWAAGGARDDAVHYCPVVTAHSDFECVPLVAPYLGAEHNGVELHPLDASCGLCWGPFAIEPLPCVVSTEADRGSAVGKEV